MGRRTGHAESRLPGGGFGRCLAFAALVALGCGLTEQGRTQATSDSGSVGGSAGSGGFGVVGSAATSGVGGSTGSGVGGSVEVGGRDGVGGSAGAGGSDVAGGSNTTGGVVYRACAFDLAQNAVQRYQLARWDDGSCTCTVALFETGRCDSGVADGQWCLTGAFQSNSSLDCEFGWVSESLPFEVDGAVSGFGADAIDAEFELHFEQTANSGVNFSVKGCTARCSFDCRSDAPWEPPLESSVVVGHVCDHYEFWLYSPNGFSIGALDYVLAVGDHTFFPYRFASSYRIVFAVSEEDFDALVDGAAIMSGYGSPDAVFGYLDKGSVLP